MLSKRPQELNQRRAHFLRPFLLQPMPGARQHRLPAQVGQPVLLRRLVRAGVVADGVAVADEEEGGLGDLPALQEAGQGPVAVEAAIPVQRLTTAAMASGSTSSRTSMSPEAMRFCRFS